MAGWEGECSFPLDKLLVHGRAVDYPDDYTSPHMVNWKEK